MIALKVVFNGEELCLAGTDDLAVLNGIVNAVGCLGENTKPRSEDDSPHLFLSVGGLTGRKEEEDEHLRWVENHELVVGDAVTIQIVESEVVDAPVDAQTMKSALSSGERARFESAKELYFRLKDKYECGDVE